MSDLRICLDPAFQEKQESLTCDLPEQPIQEPAPVCNLEPNASDQDYFVPSGSKDLGAQLSLNQFHKQVNEQAFKGFSAAPARNFWEGDHWAYGAALFPAACKGKSSEISPSGFDDAQTKPIHNQKKRIPKKMHVPKMTHQPCYDNSVIRRKINLKVEGLAEPISVYYAGDFSASKDKLDAYVKKTFNYVAEIIPPEAMKLVLQGKQRNSNLHPYPAKFILMPGELEIVKDSFLKCGNVQLAGHVDALGGMTILPNNQILIPLDQNKIKNLDFSKDFDPNDYHFTDTIVHEILHSLKYFLNSEMAGLKERYSHHYKEAFPGKKFERYTYLINRIAESKETKKELKEYLKEFDPIFKKYFLHPGAAEDFEEYFVINGTAYLLISKKYYINRKKLKSVDPVVHDMFKAFFDNGGVDTTPFEKPAAEK